MLLNSFFSGLRKKLFILTLLLILLSAGAFSQIPPDLDSTVARILKTFEVPGLSLAVVKDGRVILTKGYGVRKLGEASPVTAKTLFVIASNTKVFTSTAIGLLVEEGKLEWDAPVVNYLPDFQLWDPYVTREFTIRDLLVHRSGLGLGAGDLLWWPESTYSRKDIVRRMRYIKPATSFRSTYAYSNLCYLVAGEVIEKISGESWEDFVEKRILKKVGMNGSFVRYTTAEASGHLAASHAKVENAVRPVAPFTGDAVNPTGGIVSSAEDMAKWMLVLLGEGKLPDGSRLFSERTARELTSMVTPIPIPAPAPEIQAANVKMNFNGYGLGLRLRDYRGYKVATHTGGMPGFVSQVWLMPDLGLGITVLTNQEVTQAFQALTFYLADYYLKAPKFDWVDALLKVKARVEASVEEQVKKAAAARNTQSKPSLPLEKYAGTYVDSWYGEIEVALRDGRLEISFTKTPSLKGELIHWQYDTFIARWFDRELRADAYLTFSLNPDGSIEQAKMAAVSPDTDFSFDFQDLLLKPARKPEKK